MGDALAVVRERQHHHPIAQIAAARIAPGEIGVADPDLTLKRADVLVLDRDDVGGGAELIDIGTGPRRLARTEDNFGTTASATVRP